MSIPITQRAKQQLHNNQVVRTQVAANSEYPVIEKDKFCEILYDHAKLMEGENLDDPKKYTNLVSELVSL